MSQAFDAYHKWLGIPAEEQPPHRYRLLGIKLFEDDPDVISSAADQRMAHLRTFQSGLHAELSQLLLNEVATARTCLLNERSKATYDQRLRKELEQWLAPTAAQSLPQTLSVAPLVAATQDTLSRWRSKQDTRRLLLLTSSGAVCLIVLMLVAGLWILDRWHSPHGKMSAVVTATPVAMQNEGRATPTTPAADKSAKPLPPPPRIDPPTTGGPPPIPRRVQPPRHEIQQVAPVSKRQDVVCALRPRQRVMGTWVNYYRPMSIQLRDAPSEHLIAEPAYRAEKAQYGELRLGDGPDKVHTVVVDEPNGEEPRIFIDLNNDEDLTNDGNGAWGASTESTLRLSNLSVDVSYASSSVPYTLQLYRFKSRLRDKILYYRDSGREGTIMSNRKPYRVAILDENADGRFDDLENGTIIIDLDQDGKLIGRSDSAERHKLSEPFNIHGQVWEVASLSPDGTQLKLRVSDADVSMQRYLQPGHVAPDFTGTDLSGQRLSLGEEAAESKLVLLDFWASWCGPCRSEFPHLRAIHEKYADQGVRIIGISLDSDPEKASEVAEENGLSYSHLCDGKGGKSEVARLYRVSGIPKTFLLDSNLKIVARDLRGEALERKIAELVKGGATPARRPRLLGDLLERQPVPSDEAQAAALAEVQRRFAIDAPRTQMERILLARRMISDAAIIEPSNVRQYVVLSESFRVASEQGALNTAFKAIDELEKHFAVNVVSLRMDAAATSLRSDVPKATKLELARMSLPILDDAIEAKMFDAAEEFSQLITNVALGLKNRPLLLEVNNREAKLTKLEQQLKGGLLRSSCIT